MQTLPGNKIELELKLSGAAPTPLSFTIDNPARIALDLPNTTLALPARRKDVGVGALATILAAESGGRTRVVLNLNSMVPYETRVAGNSVFVTLGGVGTASASARMAAVAPTGHRCAAAAPSAAGVRSIQNVDFRRGENGGGRVVVNLSDVGTPVDVRKEADQVVLSFANTQLPDALMKRLDVTDFATPVETVDVMRVGNNARIVISARAPTTSWRTRPTRSSPSRSSRSPRRPPRRRPRCSAQTRSTRASG